MPAAQATGRRATATRLVFLAVGLGGAGWAALVPYAKARAGLDDGALGLVLLGLGVGSTLFMPLAGALAPRLGCRALMAAGLLVLAGALLPLATLSSPVGLTLFLALLGAGLGTVDVAMNMQAIIVEREAGRALMSGFHGMFSLGGILGAGGAALLLGAGVGPAGMAAAAVLAVLGLLAAAWTGLLPFATAREGPAFALPRGIVLFLGLGCFAAFLGEGAVLDWGAVFLHAARDVPEARAGLGYAAFSVTMTVGRFTGDRLVARLGARRVLAGSAVLAAAGFAVATLLPGAAAGLAGFALVGAGCANIVPVLFTAVGRQRDMPEAVAVPAMTTLGYAGILSGPAAIGAAAHLAGLPAALGGVGLLLLATAALARVVPGR